MINQSLIPLTYDWVIRRKLSGYKTVLDLGCSDGALMAKINSDRKCKITGVDIFKPDLAKAKLTGVYQKLVHKDIMQLKLKQKFDVVIASQVIEHLSKKEGRKLVDKMESLAGKRVIIGTTVGYLPYEPLQGDDSGNIHQEHKSGWQVDEFRKLGYKVYGQGTRIFYQENGILRNVPHLTHPLFFVLSYLFSPLNYYFPKESAYLQIAVKDM